MNGNGAAAEPGPSAAEAAEVLDAIPRELGRAWKAAGGPPPGTGCELWTAYELQWLGPGGMVHAATLGIVTPGTSPNLIESRSLKMYLFGFRRRVFASEDELLARMRAHLTALLECEPALALNPRRVPREPADFDMQVVMRYRPDLAAKSRQDVTAHLRRAVIPGAAAVAKTIHVPGYMSLCPHSGQPDYADVDLFYDGPDLDWEVVGEYLATFSDLQGFHEDCTDRVMHDFVATFRPRKLHYAQRYLRRGGIECHVVRAYGCPLDGTNYRFSRH